MYFHLYITPFLHFQPIVYLTSESLFERKLFPPKLMMRYLEIRIQIVKATNHPYAKRYVNSLRGKKYLLLKSVEKFSDYKPPRRIFLNSKPLLKMLLKQLNTYCIRQLWQQKFDITQLFELFQFLTFSTDFSILRIQKGASSVSAYCSKNGKIVQKQLKSTLKP